MANAACEVRAKNVTKIKEPSVQGLGDFDERKLAHLEIYEHYKRAPFLSIKHSSYFQVYEDLLRQYRNRPITFVEIGVLNGGSLFMWREYLGKQARIIGIDLNPIAKRWENDGFEIYIGSQSDSLFWDGFFRAVGQVDVVLDDGGHTYEQQILTASNCIPYIKDGGLLIVEDTHTSYFRDFGYPSRYSFIEWTKTLIDNINSRFPAVKESNRPYRDSIFSISAYESIVAFKIDRAKCFESSPTTNGGLSVEAEDYRHKGTVIGDIYTLSSQISKRFSSLRRFKALKMPKDLVIRIYTRFKLHKLKRFF
jgi:hypothetical protein